MIYIDRKRIKRPAFFSSPEVEKYNLLAAEYFSIPIKKRRQGRFSFKPLHGQPEVRKALQRLFHGKCAYCESQIIGSSPQTIDFFRPMMGTVDLQGHYFTDHYWWLAYEWDNLYSSCPECNRAKGNRFPISAVRAQPKTIGTGLLDEKPLLLDPCQDLPEKHLVFSASGEVAGATERGNITIEVLALNRSSLIDARQTAAKQLMAQWENLSVKRSQGDLEPEALAQMIESLANDSQSYAGMRRQLITQLLRGDRAQVKDRPEEAQWQTLIKQFAAQQAVVTKKGRRATFKRFSDFLKEQDDYSLDSGKAEENYFLRTRLIERIEIHNFRCISDGCSYEIM